MAAIGARRTLLLGTENSDGTVTGVLSGTSQPVDSLGFGANTVYLRSVGTTSGGTILVEEADWGPLEGTYTGTWAQVASVAASSFTGGAISATHATLGAYKYLRVRISSAITGGGTILASLVQQEAA